MNQPRPGRSPRRVPNRRGEGIRLRYEIVDAATALLDRRGIEDDVTLRGIADALGLSAPSIYAHFYDRDAILSELVANAFSDLDAALQAVLDDPEVPPGLPTLNAMCGAYLTFATQNSGRYRAAFARTRVTPGAPLTYRRPFDSLAEVPVFGQLLAAALACTPDGEEAAAHLTATLLWCTVHGYATLAATVPTFPWPDPAVLAAQVVTRVAQREGRDVVLAPAGHEAVEQPVAQLGQGQVADADQGPP